MLNNLFLQETEREIEMYKGQYTIIQRKILKITQEHEPLANEIEDIQQRLDSLSSEAESLGVSCKNCNFRYDISYLLYDIFIFSFIKKRQILKKRFEYE
jgi:chromosome segregation ATPase